MFNDILTLYCCFVRLGFASDQNENITAIFACRDLLDLVLRQNPTNMYVDVTFRFIPSKPKAVQLMTMHFEVDNCVS